MTTPTRPHRPKRTVLPILERLQPGAPPVVFFPPEGSTPRLTIICAHQLAARRNMKVTARSVNGQVWIQRLS